MMPRRPLPRLPVLPEPLGHHGDVSPCRVHDCRACCFDTEMPLFHEDVLRLERATGRARSTFTVDDPETGGLRLRNQDGHCVFLEASGCSVYADRPAGCRLYPLVHDPDRDRGVRDDACPYRSGFRIRARDRDHLAALVDALDP